MFLGAAESGHLETVRYLGLETNADPNLADLEHFTPLSNAARHGHLDVLLFHHFLLFSFFTYEMFFCLILF